jgi:hypothetical protein
VREETLVDNADGGVVVAPDRAPAFALVVHFGDYSRKRTQRTQKMADFTPEHGINLLRSKKS